MDGFQGFQSCIIDFKTSAFGNLATGLVTGAVGETLPLHHIKLAE